MNPWYHPIENAPQHVCTFIIHQLIINNPVHEHKHAVYCIKIRCVRFEININKMSLGYIHINFFIIRDRSREWIGTEVMELGYWHTTAQVISRSYTMIFIYLWTVLSLLLWMIIINYWFMNLLVILNRSVEALRFITELVLWNRDVPVDWYSMIYGYR